MSIVDGGSCNDCGEPVGALIATRDQFVGNEEHPFICIDCKCERMTEKTKRDVAALRKKAQEVQESQAQMRLAT